MKLQLVLKVVLASLHLISKYEISSRIFDNFEWEIELSKADAYKIIHMKLCFVDSNKCDKNRICDYFLPYSEIPKDSQGEYISYMLYVWTLIHRFALYGVRNKGSVGPAGMRFREGDSFKLLIDFTKKHCSLYHNGKFIDVIYKDIPNDITFGWMTYRDVSITCTKFSGSPRKY